MATFEINLNKITEDINALNRYIKNYKETILNVKSTLKNVDSFWADYNTEPFIKTINNDEKNFKNHINAISSYIDVIEKFCAEIRQCFLKNTGHIKVVKLKYNSSNTSLLIQDLDRAKVFLTKALSSLETINVPLTFKYRIILDYYEQDLKNYIKTITMTKFTLENINRTLNGIFANAKARNARVEFKTIDSKKLGYRWRTYSSNFKTIEDIEKIEHNLSSNNINQDVQITAENNIDVNNVAVQNNVVIELLDVDDVSIDSNGNLNAIVNDNNGVSDVKVTYVGDLENLDVVSKTNEGENINISYDGNIENTSIYNDGKNINEINIKYNEEIDYVNSNLSGNQQQGNIDLKLDIDEKDLNVNNGNELVNQVNVDYEGDKRNIIDSNAGIAMSNVSSDSLNMQEHSNLNSLNTITGFNNVQLETVANDKSINSVNNGQSLNSISSNYEIKGTRLDEIENL